MSNEQGLIVDVGVLASESERTFGYCNKVESRVWVNDKGFCCGPKGVQDKERLKRTCKKCTTRKPCAVDLIECPHGCGLLVGRDALNRHRCTKIN